MDSLYVTPFGITQLLQITNFFFRILKHRCFTSVSKHLTACMIKDKPYFKSYCCSALQKWESSLRCLPREREEKKKSLSQKCNEASHLTNYA